MSNPLGSFRLPCLILRHAAEWGIRTNHLGVLGFSAGDATAAITAIKNIDRAYAAVDAVDKFSCRPDFAALLYPTMLVDKEQKLLRQLQITKDTPPIFFVRAFEDHVRCENSVQLFLALNQAGVPSELRVYDAGGHGFGLRPLAKSPITTWPQRREAWLARNGWLKNGSPP